MIKELQKNLLPLFDWHANWHYQKQLEFINAIGPYWEVIFLAGNGSGKSHTLYWNLVTLALGCHPMQRSQSEEKELGPGYFYAEPPLRIKVLVHDFEHGFGKIFTDTVLTAQILPDKSMMGPLIDKSMVQNWPSRDDRTLVLKPEYGGSSFFFQTSEQKKRLHSGTNFDILACDEEPEQAIYDESKRGLRTAKGSGRILHAFTPPFDEADRKRGPSWSKFKLIDPFDRNEDPDIYVVRAAMKDNPAVTPEFIRKFSKGKTEEQLRIQLYGDYPTWGDLVFPEFQAYLWDSAETTGHLLPYDFAIEFNDPESFLFEMAIDWHGSKPISVIWTIELRCGYWKGFTKGDVIVYDEISSQEAKGWTISQACDAIRDHEGWRRMRIVRYGDPKLKDRNNALVSGFSPWDEFSHCGIRMVEGWNREPYVGYSVIRDFLRGKGKGFKDHPRLFVKETCKTLIHNMQNHYNVPRTGGLADPDPQFSDYCVCLKYIMQHKSRKIKKNMDRTGRYSQYPLTSREALRKDYVKYHNVGGYY